MNPGSRAGFTLIELMVVTVLLAVVGGAVYSNFSAGTRLWKALLRPVPEEALTVFYLRASEDFRQMVHYKPILFEGTEDKASFAALIHTEPALGGDRGIGQVIYSYDPRGRAIVKEVRNVSDIFKEKPGRTYALYGGVHRFSMAYFIMDKQTKKTEWVGEWTEEEGGSLPIAVRFDFEADTEEGRKQFVRTFQVPTGGLL